MNNMSDNKIVQKIRIQNRMDLRVNDGVNHKAQELRWK